MIEKINDEVLCVLVHQPNSKLIKVDSIAIEKSILSESKLLEKKIKSNKTKIKKVIKYIEQTPQLKLLFNSFGFCSNLNGIFQDLPRNTFPELARKLNEIELNGKKKRKAKKKEFIRLCNQLLTPYFLTKTYKKADRDKSILAYSHRKVGWNKSVFNLNSDFNIEFKTNFGYGRSSYFYTIIRYKGLELIPFSDWVIYRYAKLYEVASYSANHKLENTSWFDAMKFCSDAYNLSITNEKKFIVKYLVNECEMLISGLEKILIDSKFSLREYTFIRHKSNYRKISFNRFELIQFRGERISGALSFIKILDQFKKIHDVSFYISKIERLNKKAIKPIKIESEKLKERIERLKKKKKNRKKNCKIIKNKLEKIDKKLEKKTNKKSDFSKLEIRHRNITSKYSEQLKKLYNTKSKIKNDEIILKNLKSYLNTINKYFQK